MSKFVEYIFEDVLTLKYGKNQKKVVDENGDYPILGTGGIMGYANQYLYDKPSVLIGRKGTINKPVYMDTPFWTIDTLFYTEVNEEKVNPKYLYYRFLLINFLQFNEATGVPSLKTHTLNKIPLKIHESVDYQKKIAKVLSDLDAKIELNNRINAELEAMAKLVYDYWFVQFDFPNKEGKPYKSSGGEMVYSAVLKREVPLGWYTETVNSCTDLILDHRGKTPKKLGGDWTNDKNGIIALSAKIVKNGKLVNLKKANKVSQALYDKWMTEKLIDGDVLMTSEAPAGEFYFIFDKTNYCLSQRLFALRADKKKIFPTYFYYEMSRGHGYSQVMGRLSGSTVLGIRQSELRQVQVLIPDFEVQKTFNQKVLPMLSQIRKLDIQNQELQQLRDWLLPMLMNGQVRVESDKNI